MKTRNPKIPPKPGYPVEEDGSVGLPGGRVLDAETRKIRGKIAMRYPSRRRVRRG